MQKMNETHIEALNEYLRDRIIMEKDILLEALEEKDEKAQLYHSGRLAAWVCTLRCIDHVGGEKLQNEIYGKISEGLEVH